MAGWPHAPRTPWRADFPEVFAQVPYRQMRQHPAYRDAKDGVSGDAALSLVTDCMADEAMNRLRKALRGRRPRVVAVHSEEAVGRNKIPTFYAEVLASVLRLDTDPGIVQSVVANHTDAPSIFHRFVSPPLFDGYVEAGIEYLIVDDTCTAGGTLANLKGFIENSGGIVVGMSVLGLAQPQLRYDIALAEMTLSQLKLRHGGLERYWREEFGYGIDCLTEGEAGHVYSAPSLDTLRNRLLEARRDVERARSEEANCGESASPAEVNQEADDAAKAAGSGVIRVKNWNRKPGQA